MNAKDYRAIARNALLGKWGLAVGTGFVATCLGAYTASENGRLDSSSDSDSDFVDKLLTNSSLSDEMILIICGIIIVFSIAAIVCIVASLILSGPITLGYVKFNLNLIDGTNPKFGDLFSQFHRFGEGFVMQLLRGIFVLLWSLLLVIPGIIAGLSYAMAPYILYENPDMSGSEAIKASKELMDGNKWHFFCLNLSFLGWDILCILTLGIGCLWITPYRQATYAAFYRGIKQGISPVESENNFDVDNYFRTNMQNFNM